MNKATVKVTLKDTSIRFWVFLILSLVFSTGTSFGWLVEDRVNIYVEALLALAGMAISLGFLGLAVVAVVENVRAEWEKEVGK